MRTVSIFIILSILDLQSSLAQVANKITGPLGVYHIDTGDTYADSLGTIPIPLQSEFRFGEPSIPNQAFDNGTFSFQGQMDSCAQWKVNRIFGIIQPPTEHGIYDQTGDTALCTPYPQIDSPGMVQGGQRFSRLSRLYGGYSGVILDDWNHDTSITRQVRDAVRGKYLDATGTVHSDCPATTPYNKLFCVIYNTDPVPDALQDIDGVCYAYFQGQNCCYMNLDSDIARIRTSYPGKEIIIAIYLRNTFLGWTDPVSVQYMLQHSLDSYDDGNINGVTLFAGSFLITSNIPDSNWTALALPFWLDSLYYPYLGMAAGVAATCSFDEDNSGIAVRAFCTGRLSGDTLMRSYQMTDVSGRYQFGLWAGNRDTDSTWYWMIAEKPGYISDTIGFWVKRADTTYIPSLQLCPGLTGTTSDMLAYPNPTTGWLNIETIATETGTSLDVYDMMGRRVISTASVPGISGMDLSGLSDGIYVLRATTDQGSRLIGEKKVALAR